MAIDVSFVCAFCGKVGRRAANYVHRAIKDGLYLYCDLTCSGAARRVHKTIAEKKAEKAEYDRQYRAINREQLRAKKAAHFQRTYDPIAAAVVRKARMPKHVEYCRQPEYREKKAAYDRQHRAAFQYGEFAEAALLLSDVETEVTTRMSKYEIYQEQGRLNKSTRRKRAAAAGSVALG